MRKHNRLTSVVDAVGAMTGACVAPAVGGVTNGGTEGWAVGATGWGVVAVGGATACRIGRAGCVRGKGAGVTAVGRVGPTVSWVVVVEEVVVRDVTGAASGGVGPAIGRATGWAVASCCVVRAVEESTGGVSGCTVEGATATGTGEGVGNPGSGVIGATTTG